MRVRALIIALLVLVALDVVSANICFSNCGGASSTPATRTPLGGYIEKIGISHSEDRRTVDGEEMLRIDAIIGVDACGIDSSNDGDACDETEILCSDHCAQDCDITDYTQYSAYSCVTKWVEQQMGVPGSAYENRNTYCVLSEFDLNLALESDYCDECDSNNDCGAYDQCRNVNGVDRCV